MTGAELRALGAAGVYCGPTWHLFGRLLVQAREEIHHEPGTAAWLDALAAWFCARVERSRDTWRHPAHALVHGKARYDHQCYALAWLCMEGFGVEPAEVTFLSNATRGDHLALLLVGPQRWVADPWHRRVPHGADGLPMTLEALFDTPEVWGDAAPFLATKAPRPNLDVDPPPLAPSGFWMPR